MPKQYFYRREFVNIRISKRLYDYLVSQRRYKEPLDRIADRIFSNIDNAKAVEEHHDMQEIIDNKNRLIKTLTEDNNILRQEMKELKGINLKINQFIDNDR